MYLRSQVKSVTSAYGIYCVSLVIDFIDQLGADIIGCQDSKETQLAHLQQLPTPFGQDFREVSFF